MKNNGTKRTVALATTRLGAPSPEHRPKPLEMATKQPTVAADLLDLDEGPRQTLGTPRKCLTVAVPVRMDNGKTQVFTGHRVQHSTTRGPAKGGIRYHPD